MEAQEVLIEICIHYSFTEKHQKMPILIPPAFNPDPYAECKLYLLEQGMKRRNEEGEEGLGWKNSQGTAQFLFSKQKV